MELCLFTPVEDLAYYMMEKTTLKLPPDNGSTVMPVIQIKFSAPSDQPQCKLVVEFCREVCTTRVLSEGTVVPYSTLKGHDARDQLPYTTGAAQHSEAKQYTSWFFMDALLADLPMLRMSPN
ncbi:hypothetical protein UY3_16931 [Chelonia mydas]|uniref:Uncharacterized protein n=1 Tax=Chelonia mydas TaxID=8469 RepID=M7AN43_CHEMY|nr:hypothetical protein UY3_16931 [Chelonia mydas]